MAQSLYILVYKDPLLTYLLDPFGICAIYLDHKVISGVYGVRDQGAMIQFLSPVFFF